MEILPEGEVVRDRYKVRKVLGKGGMSTVYLVEDGRLPEKLWAMKEMGGSLPEDIKNLIAQQFKREAEILARLSHARLPKVIDYFTLEGRNYLVMEYLVGMTLQKTIAQTEGFLGEERIRKWGIELCEVLEYLHSQSPPIIFRDIKPDNIIVDPEEHLKLIDFGIARLFDPGKQEDTIVIGTPGFSAPEQYGRGQTDERADIYSLGATLYYMATDLNPAENPFSFLIPSSVNPGISSELDSAILTSLDIDPAGRFPSAEAFKRALRGSRTSRLESEVSPSVSSVEVEIEPLELDFSVPAGRSPITMSLTVRNQGRKPLRATLSTNRPWLFVSPEYFEENEKDITVTVNLKDVRREREYRGRIVLNTAQNMLPIPVVARVLPFPWERELPPLIISLLFFGEAMVPLLGTPGIIITYLMLGQKERTMQKIPFVGSLIASLGNLLWFLR